MSVSAVELSEMSRESGTDAGALESIRRRLDVALPRVAFFVIPSAVALFLLGHAIVGILLQYGKFGPLESARTAAILAGSSIGLLASALGRLYSSTCFALRDTRAPLRFAIVRVALAAALGYLFALHLPRLLWLSAWTGAIGLTLSAGLAGWVEFLLLRRTVVARVGPGRLPRGALLRVWAAALPAGALGFAAMRLLDGLRPQVRGALSLALFGLAYGLLTLALGVPEARALVARLRRR
jgi:putative peptidoglycan lipid II flippase